ncbi:MAG TPA: choice-of-anchor D domain-containing protein [Patescibacteria group bacterium]|nr:choice-of-anchor D domain-containing protein [Patescibacteria group bacterium]
MKKILILLVCFFALCFTAGAQSLDVYNIDASQFPEVRANFRAIDVNGNSIRNLSAANFQITENGIPRNVISISCPVQPPKPALSSVLTIDISGSMSVDRNGVSNLDLAKTAAGAWIDGLPDGESDCAITAFDNNNYFIQDFTSNKQTLHNSLLKLSPSGGTNYHEGFMLPVAGGLEVIKAGKHKRVLIFLSDGLPNFPPDEDAIVAMANQLEVTIFCVTLGLPMPDVLKNISRRTNGEWFENVTTKQEAEDTYRRILDASLGEQPCTIRWQSEIGCILKYNVKVSIFNNTVHSERSYTAPVTAFADIEISPVEIRMKRVVPGKIRDSVITLTARNRAIRIDSIIPSSSAFTILDYGGSAPPFVLEKDQSRRITVRFTPVDSVKIFSEFTIFNNACSAFSFAASGGFMKMNADRKSIMVTSPNGGEVFVVGQDTNITWKGVMPRDTVELEFSSNQGKNWTSINPKAQHLKEQWHVPNIVSDSCLVRVRSNIQSQQLDAEWEWIRTPGNSVKDQWTTIATVDDNGDTYLTGMFYNTIDFGNGVILTDNTASRFLAKFDVDGDLLWARKIAGHVYAGLPFFHRTDGNGNIYITGYFSGTIALDGISLSVNPTETGYFFAKLSDEGSVEWANQIDGGAGGYIATDGLGNVFLGGTYSNSTDFGNGFILPAANNSPDDVRDIFIAKYSPNGTIQWAKNSKGMGVDVINVFDVDRAGNLYLGGEHILSVDFGNGVFLPNSKNSNQHYIVKYNANGIAQWVQPIYNSYDGRGYIANVNATNNGSLYVTGHFSGRISFPDNDTLKGENDIFYLKYNVSDGRKIWGKRVSGRETERSVAVTTDPEDNFYLLTRIITTIGTATSQNSITKFSADGNALWTEPINGNDNALSSLTIDNSGALYTAGTFNEFISFGSKTVHNSGSKNIVLAKYSPSSVAASDLEDTSDAVFSIVKPTAASRDIDMGRVLVLSTKDSVIRSFIQNTGSYAIQIKDINITGANYREFQIVSGIPPFTIPAGEEQAVEFRFHPLALGTRTATISIVTQADSLYQAIRGEGVLPILEVAASAIDFGVIEVGSLKDTIVAAVLKNIGDAPLAISNIQMLGPDKDQFEIISGGGSFTLVSGATQTMQLRFAPKYIGRTSGQIGFDYDGMPGGRPAVVQLFGQGIGGNVYVMDDSAYVGETRDVKLMLGKVKPASIAQTATTSFRATLAFKNSILTPARAALLNNAVFKKGVNTDTLTIAQQWSAQSNELARIPFMATLGDRLSSEIELIEFSWLDDSGSKVEYDTELQSGIFTVLGICPEGGDRLFSAEGKAAMMMVMPHPVSTSAKVYFKTIEKGTTVLTLTDALGRQTVLTSRNYEVGEHVVEFPAENLTQGVYILTMQTPTQIFTQQVIIGK